MNYNQTQACEVRLAVSVLNSGLGPADWSSCSTADSENQQFMEATKSNKFSK